MAILDVKKYSQLRKKNGVSSGMADVTEVDTYRQNAHNTAKSVVGNSMNNTLSLAKSIENSNRLKQAKKQQQLESKRNAISQRVKNRGEMLKDVSTNKSLGLVSAFVKPKEKEDYNIFEKNLYAAAAAEEESVGNILNGLRTYSDIIGDALNVKDNKISDFITDTAQTYYDGSDYRQSLLPEEDEGKVFTDTFIGKTIGQNTMNIAASLVPGGLIATNFLGAQGRAYKEALDSGADPTTAKLYALAEGSIEGLIENKLGVENLLKGKIGESFAGDVFNAALGEGLEEVLQGLTNRTAQNIGLGYDNPIVSLEDDNAIFNPITSAKEFAGGFVGGGLLGAPVSAVNRISGYFSKNDKGENVLNAATPDGTVTSDSIDNVTFDSTEQADMYKYASTLDTDTANRFLKQYKENYSHATPKLYTDGFRAYYEHGVSQLYADKDFDITKTMEKIESIPSLKSVAAESIGMKLTDKATAYMAGYNKAQAKLQADLKAVPTFTAEQIKNAEFGVINRKDDAFKNMSKEMRTVVSAIAKTQKVKVVVVDNITSNGFYDRNNDIIYLNSNSQTPATYILGHEITHRNAFISPAEHKEFSDYAINTLKSKDITAFNKLFESKKGLYETTLHQTFDESYINEEIVADSTAKLFNDADFVEGLVKQNRSLAQKILDFIKDLIGKITGKGFKITEKYTIREAEMLSEADAKDLQEIRRLFEKALAKTKERVTGENVTEKSSETSKSSDKKEKTEGKETKIQYAEDYTLKLKEEDAKYVKIYADYGRGVDSEYYYRLDKKSTKKQIREWFEDWIGLKVSKIEDITRKDWLEHENKAHHFEDIKEGHIYGYPYFEYYQVKKYEEAQKNTDSKTEGVKYSISDVIDLSDNNELSALVENVHGASKYKIIGDFILNTLSNQPIILSDGKSAVVDKSDAMHIAHKSGSKKTAQINRIREVVKKAKLIAEERSQKKRKFEYFYYYEAFVKYENKVFPIYVNVGRSSNDKLYHIYDITEKLRDTAHRVNDVERLPKSYALKNSVSKNNIPDISENVNTSDKRFSLSSPVEQVGELVAVHNLNEQKLKGNFELGGLPAPSVAITKAQMGHNAYGDISLVFSSDTIDPEFDSRNDVFSADAYTSRFPQIDIKIKPEALKSIADRLDTSYSMLEANEFSKSTKEDIVENLKRNHNARKAFVNENNIEVKPVLRQPEFSSSFFGRPKIREFIAKDDVSFEKLVYDEDMRNEYYNAIRNEFGERKASNGMLWADRWIKTEGKNLDDFAKSEFLFEAEEKKFNKNKLIAQGKATPVEDAYSYQDGVNNAIKEHSEEFEEWVSELVTPAIGKKYIRKDVDPYTRNGDRKSFEQMHDSYTLANIIKNMKRGTNVETGFGGVGIGEMRASTSQKYSNIDEIRQSKSRLQNLTDEEIEAAYNDAAEMLTEVRNKLYQYSKFKSGNSFMDLDNVGENIKDAFMKYSSTNGIIKYLKEYYPQAPQSAFNGVIELKQILEDLPVKYFEAKPMRAVGFDEVKYAVVPDDISEDVRKQLEKYGVKVVEYDKTVEGDRTEKLNSLNDVKFSLSPDQIAEVGDLNDFEEVLGLESDITESLTEDFNKLVKITKGKTVDKQTVRKTARNFVTRTMTGNYYKGQKFDELVDRLYNVFNYLAESDSVDLGQVSYIMKNIAGDLISHSESKIDLTDEQEAVKKAIREKRIYVPEHIRNGGDFDNYGGFEKFRKLHFGKLRIVYHPEGATSWDELYETFNEEVGYPIFDKSDSDLTGNSAASVLERLSDVYESLQPAYINPYEDGVLALTNEEQKGLLGWEMLESYFEIAGDVKTEAVADSFKKKIDKIKADNKVKREELEKKFKAKYTEGKKAVRDRMKESANKKKYRQRINKDIRDLNNMLLKPTEKKHVPIPLEKPLAEFLKSIDTSSERLNKYGEPTERTRVWEKFLKEYKRILENPENNDYVEIDPEIVQRFEDLTEKVENVKLDELSASQLRELSEIIKAVKHSISEANKFAAISRNKTVNELAVEFEDTYSNKHRKELRVLKEIDKLFNFSQLDAYSYFKKLGTAGETIYKGLETALDQKITYENRAVEFMQELLDGKEVEKWSGDKAEIHTFEVEDGTLNMTESDIMGLMATNMREQGKSHLYGGGIVVESKYRDAKIGERSLKGIKEKVRQARPIRLKPEEVGRIIDTLSDEQKNIVRSVVEFMSGEVSSWGNIASRKVFGIDKFKEDTYFPIKSVSDFLVSEQGGFMNDENLLKSMSFTKQTVKKANNPIMIEDFLTTFTRHVEEMSMYGTFMPVLSDMNKFVNHKQRYQTYDADGNLELRFKTSVKQTMNNAFGEEAFKWWKRFVVDLNVAARDAVDTSFQKKLISNVKSASVGANLRVVIQQPTAYVRAAAIMNPKYLAKALTMKGDFEKVKKHAPIAVLKDWGYFEIGTGRQMKNVFVGKKTLTDKSMWLAGKMDNFTWAKLWNAVEVEIQDTKPSLDVGSEEYFNACRERFNEVITRTQVVDSFLHRSDLMRRKGLLVQSATSFMSEPTKSYNLLRNAIIDVYTDKTKASKKALVVTVSAFTATAFVNAIAQSLIDVFRDDEEKELKEKFTSAVGENFANNMNPLQMVPFFKDIVSIYEGYDVERLDMSGVSEVITTLKNWGKYFDGESKYSLAGLTKQSAKSLSKVFGIPLSNVMRLFENGARAVTDTLSDLGVNTTGAEYFTMRSTYAPNKDNQSKYAKLAVEARANGDKKLLNKIRNALIGGGLKPSEADSAIKRAATSILKEDKTMEALYKAVKNHDYDEAEKYEKELIGRHFTEEEIKSALTYFKNKAKEDKEEPEEVDTGKYESKPSSIYTYEDMAYAFLNGDKSYEDIRADLIEVSTAKDPEGTVNSQLKSKLRQIYKDSFHTNEELRKKTWRALKKLGYSDEDIIAITKNK